MGTGHCLLLLTLRLHHCDPHIPETDSASSGTKKTLLKPNNRHNKDHNCINYPIFAGRYINYKT